MNAGRMARAMGGATAAALILAAPSFGADASPSPAQNPDDEALASYPAAARQEGVQGAVTFSCGRNEHGAPRRCVVLSETPTGHGFRAAAVDLIAHAKGGAGTAAPINGGEYITLHFCLSPPSVTPNPLKGPLVMVVPAWLRRPSSAEIEGAFGSRLEGQSGRTSMRCMSRLDTTLSECRVLYEIPANAGLGVATLSLARYFRLRPMTIDGVPQAGVTMDVPFALGRSPPPAPPRPPSPQSPDDYCNAMAAGR